MAGHVGMLVLVKTDLWGLCAALQARGTFNTEKMAPESYPGCCQVTVYGEIRPRETLKAALRREVIEELGPNADQLITIVDGQLATLARCVFESRSKDETVIWATVLDWSFLKTIRLSPDSGGLLLITRDRVDHIIELDISYKEKGVASRNIIAMFPDEKEAVRKAFELFS